jgi:hypothetical protein
MIRDFDASFYLSVHDLHGGHTYSETDQLLERLNEVHGEPRCDIPPELEKLNGRKTNPPLGRNG